MRLVRGARLGPYEVGTQIGAGGMGEVYRATDTNLKRPVALKVLPTEVGADADRLVRFQREAELLASLSHPNIAAIYGLEQSADGTALVMELVEGPTLAERIAHGAIPLAEALPLAAQIAEALEAAHEAGVVHRDLKPANVKLRPDGLVKVLDFGIAKALDHVPGHGAGLSESKVMTAQAATEAGTILGTAPYMSPEQASGRAVDKRTDIWAFGCVLFEMLTGAGPFTRNTTPETLAAILEREPDWGGLPPATPGAVRRLLKRCLVKDPRRRLRDIGDARADLVEAPEEAATRPTSAGRGAAFRLAAVAVLAAAAAGLFVWNLRPGLPPGAPPSSSIARLVLAAPPGEAIASDRMAIAISPDGRHVAYVAGRDNRRQIYLRNIDEFDNTPLPDTEGADSPFFSPDGEWIGFGAGGRLRKVRLTGGPAQTITETVQTVSAFGFASWERDDSIYFTPTPGAGIWRVPSAGGTPTAVTTLLETENSHRWAQLLPGGRTLLFSATTAANSRSHAQSLDSGERKPLLEGVGTRYLPTGHLVYVEGGTLMAAPFDLNRLEVTGRPVAVLSGFLQPSALRNSTVTGFVPHIAFSDAGTITYLPANARPERNALVWVNRAGVEQPTGASGSLYSQPRLSPDGRRVAVTISGDEHDDVWLYDLGREAWSRFTSEGNSAFPLWTRDGRRLTYASDKGGPDNMYSKALDGSGSEERILASDRANYPFAWTADGRLIFVMPDPIRLQDIMVLRPGENTDPTPVLATQFGEGAPALSPDGRWLAYVSNESGRNEVHVRPFADSGERVTISIDGGNEPVWSPDGHELFYRSGDAMMAVDVSANPEFVAGRPRPLFEGSHERTLALWPNYDVSRDGQRFLMVKAIDEGRQGSTQINVVLNWHEELKRLVPAQ